MQILRLGQIVVKIRDATQIEPKTSTLIFGQISLPRKNWKRMVCF